jgi:hypothetical protein
LWLAGKDLLPICLLGPLLCCLHSTTMVYLWFLLCQCIQRPQWQHTCEMWLPWMNTRRGHLMLSLARCSGPWPNNLVSWCGNAQVAATSASPSSARCWHLDQREASLTGGRHRETWECRWCKHQLERDHGGHLGCCGSPYGQGLRYPQEGV